MIRPSSPFPSKTAPHVVICGSMSVLKEMEELAEVLRADGFCVSTPRPEESTLDWAALSLDEAVSVKRELLNSYFEIIGKGDLVLIANFPKHGIPGYIGANTLMEAACGHALGKPVVFLHMISDQPCRLEASAIASSVLHGDPSRLREILTVAGSGA